MNIDERIRADIERGDIGLARDRLLAHINTKGYDPDQLARLGEFSHQMHDLFSAGKYWLTSSAEGEKVDRAIETFAARCGNNPNHMFSQLPKAVKLERFEEYPEAVQSRLKEWKLEQVVANRVGEPRPVRTTGFKDKLMLVSCAALVVLMIGVGIIGVIQVFSWIIRWITG